MNNLGLAPYALLSPRFKVRPMMELLARHPRPAISILWNTFGNKTENLLPFLNLPRPKVLQIHLINEVGHRNERLGAYEVLHGLGLDEFRKKLTNKNPALMARLSRYFDGIAKALQSLPLAGTTLYISPGLESNLDARAFLNLASLAMPYFPGAIPVWNPVGNNRFGSGPLKGFVHELHGESPRLKPHCIFNLDGVGINFPFQDSPLAKNIELKDLKAYRERSKHADVSFIWFAECNLIGKGGFVDPRKRKTSPTKKHWQAIGKYYL